MRQLTIIMIMVIASCNSQEQDNDLAMCGNNIIEDGEECDNLLFPSGTTCLDYGFKTGALKCTSQCTIDISQCEGECYCETQDILSGECADYSEDYFNCGSCGNVCEIGGACIDGECYTSCETIINGWIDPYTNCWGGSSQYKETYCEFICFKEIKRLIKSIQITSDGTIIPTEVDREHCGFQANRCDLDQQCICQSEDGIDIECSCND